MEQPLSSLVFNGSIIEAITEAKQQKKLFVVYVSGANVESHQLETSTWLDPRVADSLSKYCILLHFLEGSTDAGNFSVLYQQMAAPCITAIGYNGVQLWQHEGFVSADNLASSLEKAWLSLHVQETTATFLTAVLASKKEVVSGASVSSEVGSSSSAVVSPVQVETQIQSQTATLSNNSQTVEDGEDRGHASTEIKSVVVDMASHASPDAFEFTIGEVNESIAPITRAEKPVDLVEVHSTKTEGQSSMSNENHNLCDQRMNPNVEAHGEIANKARKGPKIKMAEDTAAEKTDLPDTSSNTSHDVYLNIRLPSGLSVLVKFLVMDTLRMVKDYVDKNQTSSFGSFDLAVPYPRKVFGDEDLDRTLADLGLHNRQTLIVVLCNKVNKTSLCGQSSSAESNRSVRGGEEGYLALIRTLFSYVNPFSYLGGSSNTSNTAQDSQNSTRQYGPNSTPQNNHTLAGTPYQTHSIATENRSRKPASRFGSNIHTLRRGEDENQSSDKNTFWNGNSTQFGGDDNRK